MALHMLNENLIFFSLLNSKFKVQILKFQQYKLLCMQAFQDFKIQIFETQIVPH